MPPYKSRRPWISLQSPRVVLTILFGLFILFILQLFSPYSSTPAISDPYVFHHLADNRICNRKMYPAHDTLIEERVTILINGFSEARLPILKEITYEYSLSMSVEAIYVLWGNTSSPHETVGFQWRSGGAPVFVVRQRTTSLNDRFLPRSFIRTKSVLICDDDISVDDASLAFALRVWLENQNRIVGFFPRAHYYDLERREWIYRKLPDRYSIMLTKLMILHTDFLYKYTCEAPLGVKSFVDAATNCEDIAMNFLVSMETGVGPLLVEGAPRDWGDTRNSDEDLSSVGISARVGHKKERGVCLLTFKHLFGGMRLRYSYSKASRNVSENVICNKFGVLVHCDSRASSRLEAQRAVGDHIVHKVVRYAYVTLIGSVDYISPALVLAQTLRSSQTVHDIVLMVDDSSDLDVHDHLLNRHFSKVVRVRSVQNKYRIKGFNKLNAWLLEEYEKVVYIDVDTMVLTNLDHLFDHPEPAAAPDVYMSEKFNSGLLVIKPSKSTYVDLLSKINILPSYNKGDQGFLNSYFSGWFQMPAAHRLPSRYNAVFLFPPHYNPPSWFDMNRIHHAIGPLAVVHFAGPWHKPWRMEGNSSSTDIIWCRIWLQVSEALKENHWMPLGSDQLSVTKMLPNPDDYIRYPNATLLPVPLGFEADSSSPHQQILLQRPTGSNDAFVTIAYDNETVFAAAVWATSYQQHHSYSSWRKTLLLVSSKLDRDTWQPLVRLFNFVRVVDPIYSRKVRLPLPFMVLHVWGQKVGFDRLVYVQPLALFTENCDDLFRYEPFAAMPSVFPPDMFTSSVMLIQPSKAVFSDMKLKLPALKHPPDSVDRFLNAYFYDWYAQSAGHRLPMAYGVDMWFKEGLMKFFPTWKIILFDYRAPPWTDISEWMVRDRTKVVKLWRRTFCTLEDEYRPIKLDSLCGEAN